VGATAQPWRIRTPRSATSHEVDSRSATSYSDRAALPELSAAEFPHTSSRCDSVRTGGPGGADRHKSGDSVPISATTPQDPVSRVILHRYERRSIYAVPDRSRAADRQRHFAGDHMPELRQFVDGVPPLELRKPAGNSWIVLQLALRSALAFDVFHPRTPWAPLPRVRRSHMLRNLSVHSVEP
jgi:hypothetical protein